jgi:hypothetical protein
VKFDGCELNFNYIGVTQTCKKNHNIVVEIAMENYFSKTMYINIYLYTLVHNKYVPMSITQLY